MSIHVTVGVAISIAVHVTVHVAVRMAIGRAIHMAIHVGSIWVVVVVGRHRVAVSKIKSITLFGESRRWMMRHETRTQKERKAERF